MIKNLLPGKTIAIKKIKAPSILSALFIHLKYNETPKANRFIQSRNAAGA